MTPQVNLTLETPFVTYQRWAEETGQTLRAVEEQVKSGKLPVYIPPSRPNENRNRCKKFINVLALLVIAAKECEMEVQITSEGAA